MHDFDKPYWDRHWAPSEKHGHGHGGGPGLPPNPHLVNHIRDLSAGTALDAGCGAGTESVWLAGQGWVVLGADISTHALETAAQRAQQASVDDRVTWVEADLTEWEPTEHFDLVLTCYAHPTIPHREFYRRISGWVAIGGSLLIVGHLPDAAHDGHGHGHHHPAEATVTAADITASLEDGRWRIDSATESSRTVHTAAGDRVLHDAVVRATRLS